VFFRVLLVGFGLFRPGAARAPVFFTLLNMGLLNILDITDPNS